MGWKASCILINERGPGFLGTLPSHDPARARELIADCGLGLFRGRGMTSFEEGIFPDHLAIGAYDGAAIIGDPEIGSTCLDSGDNPLMAGILKAFPKAEILRVGLHSVVNLWSYALYANGTLKRAFGGCADDGVVIDAGDLLPEERPHFEKSVVRDGERFFLGEFDGQIEEQDAASYGEELVFDVMGRFFGVRPDRATAGADPFHLAMESFAPQKLSRWWWPFSKATA